MIWDVEIGEAVGHAEEDSQAHAAEGQLVPGRWGGVLQAALAAQREHEVVLARRPLEGQEARQHVGMAEAMGEHQAGLVVELLCLQRGGVGRERLDGHRLAVQDALVDHGGGAAPDHVLGAHDGLDAVPHGGGQGPRHLHLDLHLADPRQELVQATQHQAGIGRGDAVVRGQPDAVDLEDLLDRGADVLPRRKVRQVREALGVGEGTNRVLQKDGQDAVALILIRPLDGQLPS